MSGKGDIRRPASVPDDEFEQRWAKTFEKTKRRKGEVERAARRIGQLELLAEDKGE